MPIVLTEEEILKRKKWLTEKGYSMNDLNLLDYRQLNKIFYDKKRKQRKKMFSKAGGKTSQYVPSEQKILEELKKISETKKCMKCKTQLRKESIAFCSTKCKKEYV